MLFRQILQFSLSLIAVKFYSTEGRANMDYSRRPTFTKYQELREKLVSAHSEHSLGSDIQLSEREKMFNNILMEFKTDELSRGFQNPFNFTPSRHFFDILKSVEASPLFKLIKKMPKGTFTLKILQSCNNLHV